MTAHKDMPALTGLFADGYTPDVVSALIDSIGFYVTAMTADALVASDTDADNIYYLTRMLKAILSDEFGLKMP